MLIVSLHLAAAAAILTVLTGWAGAAIAAFTVALGIAAAWDRALLRGGRSPRAIEIDPSGEAVCLFASGEPAVLTPLGGSGVTRYWVALRLRAPLRRALLATGGMLEPEAFRQLRLWALWGRLPGVARRQTPA